MDVANRTRRGVDGSLTRLDQTRALVRLRPGSRNVKFRTLEIGVQLRPKPLFGPARLFVFALHRHGPPRVIRRLDCVCLETHLGCRGMFVTIAR
jgi:hypothetical protein